MATVAFDIDGTVAAAPHQMQELASSLMAAGHEVIILTGTGNDAVTQDIVDAKSNYLNSLGMGQSYNTLTVIANNVAGGLDQAKAQWCKDNGVDVLIDNSQKNAQAAVNAGIELVLVPWASRV